MSNTIPYFSETGSHPSLTMHQEKEVVEQAHEDHHGCLKDVIIFISLCAKYFLLNL